MEYEIALDLKPVICLTTHMEMVFVTYLPRVINPQLTPLSKFHIQLLQLNSFLYGGRMDAVAIGSSESTFTLYLTLFTLRLEEFYDYEYKASELSTSPTLARYL